MVSAAQIALVQSTWKHVLPIENEVARLFYGRLFEMDPALRSLFRSADLREQGRKLTGMITTAVNALTRLEAIVPAVRELGRRHAEYGVRDSHYDTVAGALLWTLEQGLGELFTPEVRQAWIGVYGVLAGTMKEAASTVAA
jgi:hemoglobin-like flavoprotein